MGTHSHAGKHPRRNVIQPTRYNGRKEFRSPGSAAVGASPFSPPTRGVRRGGRRLAGPVGESGVSWKGVKVVLQRWGLGSSSGPRCSRQGGGKAAHSRLICIFSLWRLRGASRAVRRRLGGCSRALPGHSEGHFWATWGTPRAILGVLEVSRMRFRRSAEAFSARAVFSELC